MFKELYCCYKSYTAQIWIQWDWWYIAAFKTVVATSSMQQERGSQRIYHNENNTYCSLFYTLIQGLVALVHVRVHYPLHSALFCFYLSAQCCSFWPFLQPFYFEELGNKEQNLAITEECSWRPGSLMSRLMICFVAVTLEELLNSQSCLQTQCVHLSIETYVFNSFICGVKYFSQE